jgi:hypothetical protein
MASEQHNHRIQPLNGNNYTTWSEEMKALLRSKGLWRLVDGKEMRPSTPAKEQEAWDIKQDRAAGELMLNLMPDQRVHIRESQDDPTAAWKALAALFVQQKASTRFVAYEEFFSIRKRSDESLPALSARVEQAMARIQELRPISFDLKTSDAELSCMAMMHALGPEYSHFTSSLALLTDLDKDKSKPHSRPRKLIVALVLIPTHPLAALRCPHPPRVAPVTPPLPALSVTRRDTVNASATRCNAPKTPTSRRSALADDQTRPTPPLLVHQSPLHHPQLQMPLRTWWNVRATQVFVPGIPLILYPLSNSMLTSIGMQTRGPLLI